MMALGSAIGGGFFLGTGQAIAVAGPAVLISYMLAAFIAVSVMYSLAELASALPSTGSFSTYAQIGIGRLAGFTVGWLYWFMLMMVLGMEITGAAKIFIGWFPSVPQWLVALIIVIILGGINLMAAGHFGEVEAWLAGIKVAAILVFLVIGVGLVTGIIPGREASVIDTMLGHGGWIPNGMSGVAIGLLAIITSFGGIEVVTIAAAEADDARTAMAHAIRSVIWRILVFYVGSVVLIVCLLPWDSQAVRDNPFAELLYMAGIPAVGRIMEMIVFIALISAFSANVYSSSRLAYSLSARGMGVRWLLGAASANSNTHVEYEHPENKLEAVVAGESSTGDIANGRTPRRSVSVSLLLALASVVLNWYLPDTLLGILINAIGMILLVVWIFIVISQMRLHRHLVQEKRLAIHMPGWPWLPWVVLVALAGLGVLMALTESGRAQLLSMGGLIIVIVMIFFVRERIISHQTEK
ncbi:amino acid permease [Schaalia sp. lx-100]|uniref:amino acid permease n=1 Tax=Schaalia sp. lx-100 TaxID=2899081 RepID=UPI001E3C048C|nr:amino acid permease [Schaalia sp. lx-100]